MCIAKKVGKHGHSVRICNGYVQNMTCTEYTREMREGKGENAALKKMKNTRRGPRKGVRMTCARGHQQAVMVLSKASKLLKIAPVAMPCLQNY